MVSIWDKDRIVQAREDAEMSAAAAAERLNITPEYLSMLENGHRQASPKVAVKMSVLFGKPLSFFLKSDTEIAKT